MSYTKGEVYFYQNGDYWVCHDCKLTGVKVNGAWVNLRTPIYDTRLEAVDHLRDHLRAGHYVEARAFIRLWREIELYKEKIKGR